MRVARVRCAAERTLQAAATAAATAAAAVACHLLHAVPTADNAGQPVLNARVAGTALGAVGGAVRLRNSEGRAA